MLVKELHAQSIAKMIAILRKQIILISFELCLDHIDASHDLLDILDLTHKVGLLVFSSIRLEGCVCEYARVIVVEVSTIGVLDSVDFNTCVIETDATHGKHLLG